MIEDYFNQKNKEKNLENKLPFWSMIKNELKNYLVDTSAKVFTYAVPMGIMEASRGLSLEQVLQSRASVALADSVLGRLYGKTLNYTRKKFHTSNAKGFKSYLVDTVTMLAIYDPAYMIILKSAGADWNQIKSATAYLTGILILTARPFSKYVLDNWRRHWKTIR
ncbi:L-alanine exporter AlaE [Candidatus Woesearchaeota archaeon]|nr:L-alanine exporter AlaE [Candidatus Woesearchaeota archaeon]